MLERNRFRCNLTDMKQDKMTSEKAQASLKSANATTPNAREQAQQVDRLFRLLTKGEVIALNDEYCDPYISDQNGRSPWYPTKCSGRKVGLPNITDLIYRRLSPDSATPALTKHNENQ